MRIAPPLENSPSQPTYCHFKFLKRVELSMKVKRLFRTPLENLGFEYIFIRRSISKEESAVAQANRVKLVV